MKRNDAIGFYNEWIEKQDDMVNKSLIDNMFNAFMAGIKAAEQFQRDQKEKEKQEKNK